MIGFLRGTIIEVTDRYFVLDTGPIGYLVYPTAQHLMSLTAGNEAEVIIHHVIKETSSELFGFTDTTEKNVFKLLLGVNGVGPRSALGILSLAGPLALKQAVMENDASFLARAPGIGKKSAEKILIELRGKIENIITSEIPVSRGINVDILDALLSMGYNNAQARTAIDAIPDEHTSTSDRLKFALQYLTN